jgi:hypothetical protein
VRRGQQRLVAQVNPVEVPDHERGWSTRLPRRGERGTSGDDLHAAQNT